MFLDPRDQTPFFGGTYFPKEPRYGMPAFRELLQRVAQYHHASGPTRSARRTARWRRRSPTSRRRQPDPRSASTSGRCAARSSFGPASTADSGGFGDAPKFPSAPTVERLLRDWHATAGAPEPDLQALYMSTLTLPDGRGRLYDQLAAASSATRSTRGG